MAQHGDSHQTAQVKEIFTGIMNVGHTLFSSESDYAERQVFMDNVLESAQTLVSQTATEAQKKKASKRLSRLERTVTKKYISNTDLIPPSSQ
jgi:hypothetical protein